MRKSDVKDITDRMRTVLSVLRHPAVRRQKTDLVKLVDELDALADPPKGSARQLGLGTGDKLTSSESEE